MALPRTGSDKAIKIVVEFTPTEFEVLRAVMNMITYEQLSREDVAMRNEYSFLSAKLFGTGGR